MPDAIELCLELLEPENRPNLSGLRDFNSQGFHYVDNYTFQNDEAYHWLVENGLIEHFKLQGNPYGFAKITDLGREVLRLREQIHAVRDRLIDA